MIPEEVGRGVDPVDHLDVTPEPTHHLHVEVVPPQVPPTRVPDLSLGPFVPGWE